MAKVEKKNNIQQKDKADWLVLNKLSLNVNKIGFITLVITATVFMINYKCILYFTITLDKKLETNGQLFLVIEC